MAASSDDGEMVYTHKMTIPLEPSSTAKKSAHVIAQPGTTIPSLSLKRQLTSEKSTTKKGLSEKALQERYADFKEKITDIEKLNHLPGRYTTRFFYSLSQKGNYIYDYRIDPLNADPKKPETRFTLAQAQNLISNLTANDYPENVGCYRLIQSQTHRDRFRVVICLSFLKNKSCFKTNKILSFMQDHKAPENISGPASTPVTSNSYKP